MAPMLTREERNQERRQRDENRPIRVIRNAADLQRMHLDKLMRKPDKPAFVPVKPDLDKLPQCFRAPEIVRNVWGSSAGVGSGDFHIYRGIRRREYERQKYTKEQIEKEEKDMEHQERMIRNAKEAEERTAKRRAKRMKKKERGKRAKREVKKEESVGVEEEESDGDGEEEHIASKSKEKEQSDSLASWKDE